jgi:hypothetical protein
MGGVIFLGYFTAVVVRIEKKLHNCNLFHSNFEKRKKNGNGCMGTVVNFLNV